MDNMEYLNDTDKKSIQENSTVSVKPIILDNFLIHLFQIESNSRIVEWSDGSLSLAIGDQFFDIRREDLYNSDIFVKYDSEMALLKSGVQNKLLVYPNQKSTRHVQLFN